MSTFAEDTAVTLAGPGRFRTTIAEGWDIAGVPNGGYVLAAAVRAMLASTNKADPITVTAHYLRPATPGPADITIDLAREGRTLSTLSASLRQGKGDVIRALGSFADLAAMEGPTLVSQAPPVLAPVEECVAVRPQEGAAFPPPFAARVDARIDPRAAGYLQGSPSGRAEIAGWLRLACGTAPDVVTLVLLADALAPPTFNAGIGPAWTPTVELTVHVRARPAPGWIAAAFRSRFVMGGLLESDGELWDSEGRLVALTRQLALSPRL